jgi:hypothetical protein
MTHTTITLTAAELDEARGWLLDCGADEDDVENATDSAITREIARQYEGGTAAFVRDIA